MSLGVDVANLVGLVLQSFFFGIFQVLFAACIYVLTSGRTTTHVNWHFLITAILMWIAIGVNFALSWSRIMDTFINLQPALAENPNAINDYFLDLSLWKEVARTAVYVVLTAVADTLFIYRLYIVYSRSKAVIVFPILLLLGSLTAGTGIEVVIGSNSSGLFGKALTGWVTSFFTISLVQNVLTTLLIVYRIWRVNMDTATGLGARTLWPVIAILLESGSIYSTTLLVLLCTYIADSFAQYIALDMLVPIIGITFTLIIVRVGLGLSHNPSGIRNVSAPGSSSIGAFALQNLSINVTRHVTVDRDIEHGNPPSAETKVAYGDDTSEHTTDPKQWGSTHPMAP